MSQNRYLPGKHYPFKHYSFKKAHRSLFSAFVTIRGSAGTSSYPAPWAAWVRLPSGVGDIFIIVAIAIVPGGFSPSRTTPSFLLPSPLSDPEGNECSHHFTLVQLPGWGTDVVLLTQRRKQTASSSVFSQLPSIPHFSSLVKWANNFGERRGWGSSE